jgi:hypothetical protein
MKSQWRKSTYSSNGGQCVEVAGTASGVAVRDTTNRIGSTLSVPAAAWIAFLASVRS